jgi:uncharacterized protein (TIGR02271 family)
MAAMNIRRDARVYAADGEVGRVTHVIVDPETREVTQLVIDQDGSEWLLPIAQVEGVDGDTVMLTGGRADLARRGRAFDRDAYHGLGGDQAREETTQDAERGGAPLLDARDDAVAIGGIAGGAAVADGLPRDDRGEFADGEPYRLQLREERLNVRTEQQEAGTVRLSRRVIERVETVEVPVREERLVIEISPATTGRVLLGDRELQAGESLEILLKEERVIVTKEPIVREEVAVRTETIERTERVEATLRREELVMDESDGLLVQDETPAVAER